MKKEVSLQYLINLMTEHRNNTDNFIRSLRFIDNGIIIANFVKMIIEDGNTFELIKGFDYEDNGNISKFREIHFKSNMNVTELTIPDNIDITDEGTEYFVLVLK